MNNTYWNSSFYTRYSHFNGQLVFYWCESHSPGSFAPGRKDPGLVLWNQAINQIAVFSPDNVILRGIRYNIQRCDWLLHFSDWSTNPGSLRPGAKDPGSWDSHHVNKYVLTNIPILEKLFYHFCLANDVCVDMLRFGAYFSQLKLIRLSIQCNISKTSKQYTR